MCKKLMFLISLVLLVLASSASATDWIGTSPYSTLWCDPFNWDGLAVPTGDAFINPPTPQDPVVMHDMTIGDIEGPKHDSDLDQTMQILDGDISIGEWKVGDGGDGTATVEIGMLPGWGEPNITLDKLRGFSGAMTIFRIGGDTRIVTDEDWECGDDSDATGVIDIGGNADIHLTNDRWRFADEGLFIVNIADNANILIEDEFRGGDNDDGFLELNISGGYLHVTDDMYIGDDGSGTINMSGGTFESDGRIELKCRDGDAYQELNMSGGHMIAGSLRINTGEGEAVMNMSDGLIECGDFRVADGDGPATVNITGGTIEVSGSGEFGLPWGNDTDDATCNLLGGVISCEAFTHDNDNWTLNICCPGVLIIDGDVTPVILDDFDDGHILVCGYIRGCGAPGDLMVDYNNVNVGRTTVWVECDPNRPIDPDPPCICCGPEAPKYPPDQCLSWTSGAPAEQHFVFLSTNYNKVANAPTDLSALVAILQAGETTYCPDSLALGACYYWRVVEVWDCGTAVGGIWHFRVEDCMIVEDMEAYDEGCGPTAVWEVWKDGAGDCMGIGGNGTGSSVYLSTDPVHGGLQSMEYNYDSTGSERECGYSEAKKTWPTPLNLVDNFEKALILYFYGDEDNDVESMWIVLSDSTNEDQSTYGVYGDPESDIQVEDWEIWAIDIADQFPTVDLSNVASVSIGFGLRDVSRCGIGTYPGDPTGTVYFDDIALCTTICVHKYAPDGDINDDCVVDWDDLKIIAGNFLDPDRR